VYGLTEDNDHLIKGDSGNWHILEVDGSQAESCTCPDHQMRGVDCKHMIAYTEWLIDEIRIPGQTIILP
jgi:hypothetical protein